MDAVTSSRRRLLRWGKIAFQLLILAVVVAGIWRTVRQAIGDLDEAGISWRDLDSRWLLAAGLLYLVGMFPCGLFWHRLLVALRQSPRLWDSVRAYFVSQPGKYVPGKFMVVVVRTTMIRGPRVDTTIAAASIFIETLTMMSLGAALGAVLLVFAVSADWRLGAFAIGSAVVVGVPTLPPVFRFLVKLTKLHRLHPEIDQSLAGLRIPLLAPGWLTIVVGWFAMGLSLWATLRAIPGASRPPAGLSELPLLTACVALSTVAGFVSGLPGGLGARELVVMQLVQPYFGGPAAVFSAIVHRCVMVGAELVAGAVLLAWRRADPGAPMPSPSLELSPRHEPATIAGEEH